MAHPDQKYIQALVSNDKELLDELYKKYFGKIKWMVLKNNGSEEDAADLFQDALMGIYHKAKLDSFELTCPLDAFLYLVCKKKWFNILAKRKNHGVTNIEDQEYSLGEDSFGLAEACHLQDERLTLLQSKLAELGESCQELLKLSWEGNSMEEVAKMLDFSYGYARKKKSECLAKLTKLVQSAPIFKALKW
ncbi:RNA polymerase sigma factor [Arthrospiribacter ruber]|uniref:Sigma-70 family RNA polymerase sigma factor n=1 Tax=Arthrospiribacter ruber TaxID=2487934 RepID=A0A951IWG9_9BACT|nr:sigma-70 family RNA polymerase sigma factor [Arthrospiribacter ruber]MBW3468500.1 sigma-70 family RNA polymerase sigma factor [Arthrospiribacter ruber]